MTRGKSKTNGKGQSRRSAASASPVVGRRRREQSTKPKLSRRKVVDEVDFDWARVAAATNHNHLERMVGDLLAEEFDDDRFIPNALRPGKDGGADGVYLGRIAGVAGPWKVATATRGDLNALKRKIKTENRGARNKRFGGLLFITPFDATPTDVRALQVLAGKGLKKGVVWARGRLRQLLRKHPWVATQHLGHQFIPGFVPVDNPDDQETAGQEDIPLVGRSAARAEIDNFLSGPERILLIVGPGGAGKSRLLRELRTVARLSKPRRSTWLRRVEQGSIEDSATSGLPLTKPILLCLDDAGRALAEVKQLLRLATDRRRGSDVKLVLAVREADARLVQQVLAGSTQTRRLELSELDVDARAAIVVSDLPRISREVATRLAKSVGSNLFLLRAALVAIKAGGSPSDVVDSEHVRDLVAQRFIDEVRAVFAGSRMGPANEVLLEVCMDVPLPLNRAEQSLEVATLKEAKLLRVVGNTLRMRADVEGDVVLGFLSREPLARVQIQRLLGGDPQRLSLRIRNLAAAGSNEPADILRRVCSDWGSRFATMDEGERAHVVDALQYCVENAPIEVENICAQLTAMSDATTDTLGPLLLEFARRTGPASCLAFARRIGYATLTEGTFSNYKLASVGDDIVDFRRATVEGLHEACALLETWALETTTLQEAQSIAPLIECATRPLLSHVVRIHETEPGALRVGEQPLQPSQALTELRAHVLDLLELLLRHPVARMRLAGATMLEHHGKGEGGMVSSEGMMPLTGQEFLRLVPLLAERLAAEDDLLVLHTIRGVVFFRWATERPSHEEAGELLLKVPSSLAFRAFDFVLDQWEWIYDLREVVEAAPDTDRWSWWVHRKLEPERPEFGRLVDDLVSQCQSPSELIRLLDGLPENERVGLLLDPWCARAPDLFESALNVVGPGKSREALSRVLARRRRLIDPSPVPEEVREALAKGDEKVLQELLQETSRFPAGTAERVSEVLIQHSEVRRRLEGLRLMQFRSDIAPAAKERLFLEALRDGDWSGHFDVVWYFLRKGKTDPEAPGEAIPDEVARTVKARLSDSARAARYWRSNDEWYLERILTDFFEKDRDARIAFVSSILPLDRRGTQQLCNWCLTPLLQDQDSFRAIALLACEWVRSGKLKSVSEVESLLDDPIGRRPLPAGAEVVARELLDMPGIEENELGLRFLSDLQPNASSCAQIAELAAQDGPLSKASQKLLLRYQIPRGVTSRSFGKPSAKLVVLKETLEKAKTLTKVPRARALINGALKAVERDLTKERHDDEEESDPR